MERWSAKDLEVMKATEAAAAEEEIKARGRRGGGRDDENGGGRRRGRDEGHRLRRRVQASSEKGDRVHRGPC